MLYNETIMMMSRLLPLPLFHSIFPIFHPSPDQFSHIICGRGKVLLAMMSNFRKWARGVRGCSWVSNSRWVKRDQKFLVSRKSFRICSLPPPPYTFMKYFEFHTLGIESSRSICDVFIQRKSMCHAVPSSMSIWALSHYYLEKRWRGFE